MVIKWPQSIGVDELLVRFPELFKAGYQVLQDWDLSQAAQAVIDSVNLQGALQDGDRRGVLPLLLQ